MFADEALGADQGCTESVFLPDKLAKYHRYNRYETLVDIQEGIDFTGWGFPYATLEEIAGWLEEE